MVEAKKIYRVAGHIFTIYSEAVAHAIEVRQENNKKLNDDIGEIFFSHMCKAYNAEKFSKEMHSKVAKLSTNNMRELISALRSDSSFNGALNSLGVVFPTFDVEIQENLVYVTGDGNQYPTREEAEKAEESKNIRISRRIYDICDSDKVSPKVNALVPSDFATILNQIKLSPDLANQVINILKPSTKA